MENLFRERHTGPVQSLSGYVAINDLFWTFQGEGANWGRRALFVRLPKCNLACSWCDTEFNDWTHVGLNHLKKMANAEPAKFAVITGGEPLLSPDFQMVSHVLKHQGFEIAVETNGTAPPSNLGEVDWYTCSPKAGAAYKVHRLLSPVVNEYKYVVDRAFDFNLLARHEKTPEDVSLCLSPEYGDFKQNLERIELFIQDNPRWRISLQTHKWMGVK